MFSKTPQRLLTVLLTVLTVAITLWTAPSTARAQDSSGQVEPLHDERRVMVWRTETDDFIDLKAVRESGGFLGVGLLDLTPELRRHFGVPEDRGVMISKILEESPAQRTDLQPADIVTTVDGEALATAIEFSMRVATAPEGTELRIERWRDGEKVLLNVPLEIRVRSQLDVSPLIVRRVEVKPGGHRVEIEAAEGIPVDHQWVQKVVDTVGESFSQQPFLQQLESLRRERNSLLEKLGHMEERLEALESELHLLHSDPSQ